MAWDAKGNLIAGSDGTGLVYRINPQGKGYVLFEAPRREITSVAVGAERHDLCGQRGRQEPQSAAAAAGAGCGVRYHHDRAAGFAAGGQSSTSVPEGTEIYALSEGQAPRKLWSSKDELSMRWLLEPTACWR